VSSTYSAGCEEPITPAMVKEYYYCPRALHLRYALGLPEPPTGSLEEGAAVYEALRRREEGALTFLGKRSIRPREKLLALRLSAPRLCLTGVLDALLVMPDGEHVPVEVKASDLRHVPVHHYYQLVAYALLVEENYGTTVKRGLVYYTLSHKLLEAEITTAAKHHLEKHAIPEILRALRETPPPHPIAAKCTSCGYHRHCRGV